MNRRFHVLFLMTVSLAMVLLLVSTTQYFFESLPDSLDTNIEAIDVNARDINGGYTPLMRDAAAGNIEHAQELIAAGADLDALSANDDRDTALHVALINVNNSISSDRIYAITKLIIESGANVRLANARGEEAIHAPLLRITDFSRRKELLKMLLDRGAFINATNGRGETILHVSISLFSTGWIEYLVGEYGQILQYDVKASVPSWFKDPLNNQQPSQKYTPMQYAQELGHVGAGLLGDVLLNRPAYIGEDFNISATDAHGRDGLMLAVLRDDEKYVRAMIDHKDDLERRDDQGNTALHYAVTSNQPTKYVRLLLAAHAPVNATNNNGDTPLMRLRYQWLLSERVPVAQMLYQQGARLEIKNNAGENIVHIAVALSNKSLAQWARGVISTVQPGRPSK